MSYAAWSVVFGEQPTASKWNILGTNDASFHDGTGIDDDAILTRHLLLNNVTGPKLSTNAVYLGRSTVTATVTPSGTTETDIISLAVTVPAGGRSVLLMVTAPQVLPNDGTTRIQVNFKEGATVLNRYYHICQSSAETFFYLIPAPSAASHTYKITSQRDSGSGATQWYADNTAPAQIVMTALLV